MKATAAAHVHMLYIVNTSRMCIFLDVHLFVCILDVYREYSLDVHLVYILDWEHASAWAQAEALMQGNEMTTRG